MVLTAGRAVLRHLGLLSLAAAAAAGPSDAEPAQPPPPQRAAHLVVAAAPAIPIDPRLFGVNYVWHLVPASVFEAFTAAMRGPVGATLMRYPGGWAAERYDWANNTESELSDSQAAHGPGVDPATFLAVAPAASFVTPSVPAIRDPAQVEPVVQLSVGLVHRFASRVGLWEIGNEWWLQRGAKHDPAVRAQNLAAYAALVARAAPAMRAAAPGAKIYATVEWTHPEDVATLRRLVGPAGWAAVDGISIHPYCGTLEAETLCSLLPERAAQIRAAAGRESLYASEWSLGPRVTADDYGIRNANQMVGAFALLAEARLDAAAYWPPVRAVPGTALLSADCATVFATGALFGWMAHGFRGAMLTASGDLPAGVASQAGRLSLVVPSMGDGPRAVTIDLPGHPVTHIVEAEVMHTADTTDPDLSRHVETTSLPATLQHGPAGPQLSFTLNPGTPGRGNGWEIARLVLE